MASLKEHPVKDLVKQYNLSTFFETGYGNGDGFKHAREHGFKQLFSCDVIQETVAKAWCDPAFHKDNESVSCSGSDKAIEVMQYVRKWFPVDYGNVLWWLDAHFPGVDTETLTWHDSMVKYGSDTPADKELNEIYHGPHEGDVIIIDDAFLYRSGLIDQTYTDRVPDQYRHSLGALEDVLDKFSATHQLIFNHGNTGSIVLTPK